jgi:hypothetical protein
MAVTEPFPSRVMPDCAEFASLAEVLLLRRAR